MNEKTYKNNITSDEEDTILLTSITLEFVLPDGSIISRLFPINRDVHLNDKVDFTYTFNMGMTSSTEVNEKVSENENENKNKSINNVLTFNISDKTKPH